MIAPYYLREKSLHLQRRLHETANVRGNCRNMKEIAGSQWNHDPGRAIKMEVDGWIFEPESDHDG
jgi:hypothetical protein